MTAPDNGSGQGLVAPTSPGESRTAAPKWAYLLTAAGSLVIIATYVAVLLAQPATLGQDLGDATLWVMLGYLAGAALIAAGTLPMIPRSIFALMPIAIALNITVGQIVGTMTPLPLYLDSIGSVIVGVLAGPAAGALTGVLGNVIWGVTVNPTVIAFTAGAAFVGAAAGWAARIGAFRAVWWAVLAGAIVGLPSGALGAPVAAFVFGGGLGVGTGGIVATLQAAGLEMLHATTLQSLASDTADKAVVFLLAFLALRTLPRRIVGRYPMAMRSLAPPRPAASGR
ncbi:histidine kinase [Leucobacter allii]|uniref:histidine kinase n=1 Tax=Leucobacter allii TaxID=2932247 RepID=UPI001FD59BC9|nr:histidine kinase [Leucobacter allii]UOR02160.1 histidine kinase [Leucobacter allii]